MSDTKQRLDTTTRSWVKPEKPKKAAVEIRIRDIEQADVAFLFNSWLKSFRSGRLAAKVDNSIYFSEHHKIIERLVHGAKTIVACNPAEPGQIFGYAVYEKIDGIFVLHYIYTKHTYRNMGIAREMLNHIDHSFETAGCCSHMTMAAEKLHLKYNLIYHPYILINYNRGDMTSNVGDLSE